MTLSVSTKLLLGTCLLSLVACGGSGGDNPVDQGGPDITPDPDLVYADGQPVTRDSYVGKTFPVSLIVEAPNGSEIPTRQTGTLEYIDADTARLTYNGKTTEFNFRSAFGNENWTSGVTDSNGNLISDLILDRPTDEVRGVTIGNSFFPDAQLASGAGFFGFSTPENNLTGSATYSSSSNTNLFVTTTSWVDENGDDTTFTRVNEVKEITSGNTRLAVDFNNGTVSGTLFDGSYSTTDDRQGGSNFVTHDLTVVIENGVVSGSGFTGDVSLETTASSNPREVVNGGVGPQGPTVASVVTINSQAVDGMFLGHAAEGVGATFEATYEETFYRGEDYFDGILAEEVTEDRALVGTLAITN